MRAAVVGLGAMGAAALAHLAARGVDVVGFEQFEAAHDYGSSHGWSRVIRQAYFEHADYVPLLKRAFELWTTLEADTGADVVHRTGVLIVGHPASAAIQRSRASAERHGIPTELLSPAQVRDRFPQFELPPDYHGLLEPGGGFAIPEHGNAAHLDVAREHGAEIRRECVRELEVGTSDVRIITDSSVLTVDHVVVAAGAWTGQLIPALRPSLAPQRKVLAWFDQPSTPANDPVWLIDDGSADGVYYGVPTWSGQPGPPGAKVGFHGPGPSVEPGVREPANPDRLAAFQRDMLRWRPDLGDVAASVACTYTMSPDEHFIVGPSPDSPRVTVACGFSGHGYKFAPVIGEVLANYATGAEQRLDVDFLLPRRLR